VVPHGHTLGKMARCRHCEGTVEDTFRFCPWCSTPQRRKLVEFFRAHPRDGEKALRVSRYLTDDPHVRFSVWDERGVATAAISLEEDEAERLAAFIARPVAKSLRDRLASLVTR
jgi:hypothetical protein